MSGRARRLVPLPVPTGPAVLDVVPALRRALSGRGPALLPVPADDSPGAARLVNAMGAGTALDPGEDDETDPTALVLATSGSTGTPKGALLGAAALAASAAATRAALAGPGGDAPGAWLLALRAHHIAGLQVVLRSLAADRFPTVLDVAEGFTAARFRRAVAAMPAGPAYTSLVPTQLHRLLAEAEATAVLAGFHAVLVGGAATPAGLLARARAAGIPVVTTYGMSETCGGCVYDGRPLAGVTITVDGAGPERVGAVRLTGAVVARGYRGRPGHPAFAAGHPPATGPDLATGRAAAAGHGAADPLPRPGPDPLPPENTFNTRDLGRLVGGRLEVVGRVDDVLISGGVKIDPAVVEEALLTVPGVTDAALTAVPDEVWGQRLVAVIAGTPHTDPDPAELRRVARAAAGPAGIPRAVLLVDTLPRRGIGKLDRPALAALAAERLGRSPEA